MLTRVLCTADICDALRASRPYRPGMPLERVMDVMGREVGNAIDPTCFEALQIAHSRRDAGSPERRRSAGRQAGLRAGRGLPSGGVALLVVSGWWLVVRGVAASREYPSHCRTGSAGYFANRESTNDNLQRENVEPRALVITWACTQVAHSPRSRGRPSRSRRPQTQALQRSLIWCDLAVTRSSRRRSPCDSRPAGSRRSDCRARAAAARSPRRTLRRSPQRFRPRTPARWPAVMSKLTPPQGADASHATAAGSGDAAVTVLEVAGSESTFEYVFGDGGATLYGGDPDVGENGSYGIGVRIDDRDNRPPRRSRR